MQDGWGMVMAGGGLGRLTGEIMGGLYFYATILGMVRDEVHCSSRAV